MRDPSFLLRQETHDTCRYPKSSLLPLGSVFCRRRCFPNFEKFDHPCFFQGTNRFSQLCLSVNRATNLVLNVFCSPHNSFLARARKIVVRYPRRTLSLKPRFGMPRTKGRKRGFKPSEKGFKQRRKLSHKTPDADITVQQQRGHELCAPCKSAQSNDPTETLRTIRDAVSDSKPVIMNSFIDPFIQELLEDPTVVKYTLEEDLKLKWNFLPLLRQTMPPTTLHDYHYCLRLLLLLLLLLLRLLLPLLPIHETENQVCAFV